LQAIARSHRIFTSPLLGNQEKRLFLCAPGELHHAPILIEAVPIVGWKEEAFNNKSVLYRGLEATARDSACNLQGRLGKMAERCFPGVRVIPRRRGEIEIGRLR
jgi:hypothetical protein